MAGIGIDRNVSQARFSLRLYTIFLVQISVWKCVRLIDPEDIHLYKQTRYLKLIITGGVSRVKYLSGKNQK